MIIVIGGIKGGTGKTTIATNLIYCFSKNSKVLFVDADEQKSSSDWVEQRESSDISTNWTTIQLSGKNIYSQLQKMKVDYEHIIVDVGGRDTTSQRSALTIADIFIVPFKPRSFDIWTLGVVRQMISEILSVNPKLKSYALINQADSTGIDNEEAKKIINECEELKCLSVSIGNRKSFSNAAAQGLSVMEICKDKKAQDEISSLHHEIYIEYINHI